MSRRFRLIPRTLLVASSSVPGIFPPKLIDVEVDGVDCVLVDNAMDLVDRNVPPPRPEDRDLALAKAQALVQNNLQACASVAETVCDADYIVTVLKNGDSVASAMAAVHAAAPRPVAASNRPTAVIALIAAFASVTDIHVAPA